MSKSTSWTAVVASALAAVTSFRFRVARWPNERTSTAPSPPPPSPPPPPPSAAAAPAARTGTISASTTKASSLRCAARAAATTSGYLYVMSSFLREKRRISPAAVRWSWQRWPSYLYSAVTRTSGRAPPPPLAADGRIRAMTSSTEVAGLASIGCVGTPSRSVPAATTPGSPPSSSAATSAFTSGRIA